MKEYTKHLSEPWFTLVKLKIKKCEGRLRNGVFAEMKKGDVIIFNNDDFGKSRSYRVKLTSIHYYDTFEQYLLSEKLEKCLPGLDTIEEGLSVYYKYFKKEDEILYKIVAIRMRVI